MLSESVGEALYLTGGSAAFETAYFVQKMDKFFDCLNVRFYNQGKLARKPFQQPSRSENDFRLEVTLNCAEMDESDLSYCFPIPVSTKGVFAIIFKTGSKVYKEGQVLKARKMI